MQLQDLLDKYSLWLGLGLAFIVSFLLALTPRWYLAILAGILGGFWSHKTGKALFSGAFGVLLGWGLAVLLKVLTQHTLILLNQIAGLIFGTEYGFLLILGILLIGAILGALGGIIGNSIRILMDK